jgi:N-acetylglucosaminyldiphosphoundecaprenol N-acetyl-beta-D-mannosaminyltransferase
MKAIHVLRVRLTPRRYEEAIDALLSAATTETRLRAHFCTVHSLVAGHDNARLRDVFESAAMVCTDGVPLVWVARLRGAGGAERVCGPDVMLTLLDRGREVGLRHYFLGGRPGIAEVLAQTLTTRFPGLQVVGTQAPPFRPLTVAEDEALINGINAADPHVLWIGLGSPKQDHWAADHEAQLKVPVLLPVGAAFDFHSGRLRRAPVWMRRLGLEWLFRLASEPRRLFGRYLVTNIRFVLLLGAEEVGRRLQRAGGRAG